MKTGKSIVELAQEIDRQSQSKRDFIASTENINLEEDDGGVMIRLGDKVLDIGDTAHTQIAAQAEIPKAYYDRMLAEQPALLADNVNAWFKAKPAKRMLRTLDGKARALLSDRYRALDNAELAEAALPALMNAKHCKNGQAFATHAEALASAAARFAVWTVTTGFGADEADEPVNYRWDDKLGNVALEQERKAS